MYKTYLFLKKNKKDNKRIIAFLKKNKIFDLHVFVGEIGQNFPKKIYTTKKIDILISYLSPWIIPEKILKKVKFQKINFHPGPPEFPGIGCFNFALHKKSNLYGVTAHEMSKKVDSGKIIKIRKFKVKKNQSIESLIKKSYQEMFYLFKEIIINFKKERKIYFSKLKWKRKAYTRKELEKLCEIKNFNNKRKLLNKIRSTYFEGYPGPYLKVHGFCFEYNPKRLKK